MPFDITIPSVGQLTMADYTRPELLVSQLRERDTAGIISELSQVLQREGVVSDVLPFYHAALNHELMSNSALECGIALPHGRLSGVKQLQFALGRVAQPVTWGSKSSWPVQLVFLLAVPATDAACYLHLLATLAKLGQEPKRVAELLAAPDAVAVMAILEKARIRS
jgi:mannitol/fructose-specific phosphotransferase system IIA component (Ntr-type)